MTAPDRGKLELDGKVALVTGSSRGIGAAIARLFADRGAKVAAHGRDRTVLSVAQAGIELLPSGGSVHPKMWRAQRSSSLRMRLRGSPGSWWMWRGDRCCSLIR